MFKDWEVIYKNRFVTVEEAISYIQPNQKVFLAPFCNEPQTIVEELVEKKERLHGVILYCLIIGSACPYSIPPFQLRTFLSSPKFAETFRKKHGEYIPLNLSEIGRWIKQEKIDVALIQVSPPNQDGYCNLGISVDIVKHLINHADLVIAEVNERLPITYGDTFIPVSDIDLYVPSVHEPLTISRGTLTMEERLIGQNVAELIPDYSTLQIGLGRLAEGILEAMGEKKGLGIHSGSIIDGVIPLLKKGVITNEHKEINRFKTICTTLTGTKELYQFAHLNPMIELYPADYTHSPAVIGKISNFHAINFALEVDLWGNINSEQVGSFPIGGVGGQVDFIKGARLSSGGKAIIALPSTAKGGTQSRIKPQISMITSLKSEVDYIVTEYGIASLFGKTLKERAEEIISIAHPTFRQALREELENH